MKTVTTNDEKESDKDGSETKENETGDKHEKVHSKPKGSSTMKVNSFEKQEELRQKMEDLVEKQGLYNLKNICREKLYIHRNIET